MFDTCTVCQTTRGQTRRQQQKAQAESSRSILALLHPTGGSPDGFSKLDSYQSWLCTKWTYSTPDWPAPLFIDGHQTLKTKPGQVPPATSASGSPSEPVCSGFGSRSRGTLALRARLPLLPRLGSLDTIPSAACSPQNSHFLFSSEPKLGIFEHPWWWHLIL